MNDTLTSKPRRRIRLWHVITALVAVSVAAIAAVYFLFFTGDSPPPLTLSTPAGTTASTTASTTATTAATAGTTATTTGQATATTPTTAAAGNALAGEWAVGASSTAGYRVREKLADLPAQSDAVGRTGAITGTIQVSMSGSQAVVATGAKFQVDVSKLASDMSMRDNRIRTMGLESNRFPTATFVSAAPIQVASASGAATKAEVTGDLTIHGVTKRVTIPLDTQLNGARIEVVGSLSFPFSDFGMTAPSIGGFVTVENTAKLEFQLFFDKK